MGTENKRVGDRRKASRRSNNANTGLGPFSTDKRVGADRRQVRRRSYERIGDRRTDDRRQANNLNLDDHNNRRTTDRRKGLRRGSEIAAQAWKAYKREQQRKRVGHDLMKREKNHKNMNLLFYFDYNKSHRSYKEQTENNIKNADVREKTRLAKSLSFAHNLDPSISAKTLLVDWQQQIAKLNSKSKAPKNSPKKPRL